MAITLFEVKKIVIILAILCI